MKACVETSKYWIQLSTLSLVLMEISLMLAGEHEKEILPFLGTIAEHHTIFILTALLNAFIGVLKYSIAVTKSRSILEAASLLLFSSPFLPSHSYSIQENLKVATIGVLVISTTMFTATWLILKIFGYSLDSFDKAVEDAKVKPMKLLKNVIFWILWLNSAIVGLGIFFYPNSASSFVMGM